MVENDTVLNVPDVIKRMGIKKKKSTLPTTTAAWIWCSGISRKYNSKIWISGT